MSSAGSPTHDKLLGFRSGLGEKEKSVGRFSKEALLDVDLEPRCEHAGSEMNQTTGGYPRDFVDFGGIDCQFAFSHAHKAVDEFVLDHPMSDVCAIGKCAERHIAT